MKVIMLLLGFLLLTSFAPEEGPGVVQTVGIVIALLTGIYEVVIRIIPTTADYTVIGKVMDILKRLSGFFNVTKK